MRSRRRGLGAVVVAVALLAAVGGGVAYYLHHRFGGFVLIEQCRAAGPAGDAVLDPEQAANAATIAGVAVRRKLPRRATAIAIATAMQESKLRNLPEGDRDSVGLFQQRPSQGWGTEKQLTDPIFAIGKFYDALVKVPRYTKLPLTVAAQKVQRSAAPAAYARHERPATVLAAALTGSADTSLTCELRPNDLPRETAGGTGLTARAESVRRELTRTFGDLQVEGAGAVGLASAPGSGTAKHDGRALDVYFRPVDAQRRQAGWAAARWAVAQAEALGIDTVRYDGKVWAVSRSTDGWRPYKPKHPKREAPTNDHVHIDVLEGK